MSWLSWKVLVLAGWGSWSRTLLQVTATVTVTLTVKVPVTVSKSNVSVTNQQQQLSQLYHWKQSQSLSQLRISIWFSKWYNRKGEWCCDGCGWRKCYCERVRFGFCSGTVVDQMPVLWRCRCCCFGGGGFGFCSGRWNSYAAGAGNGDSCCFCSLWKVLIRLREM